MHPVFRMRPAKTPRAMRFRLPSTRAIPTPTANPICGFSRSEMITNQGDSSVAVPNIPRAFVVRIHFKVAIVIIGLALSLTLRCFGDHSFTFPASRLVRVKATVVQRVLAPLNGPGIAPEAGPREVRKVVIATTEAPMDMLKTANASTNLRPCNRRSIGGGGSSLNSE